jgi:hypothetical protein
MSVAHRVTCQPPLGKVIVMDFRGSVLFTIDGASTSGDPAWQPLISGG